MTRTKVPGRLLAWAALLVALVASVAANVAFARPAAGPRLSAGVAPLLVVLAAGLLERVPLAGIRLWRRWLAYGGLGVVVVAAFVTSFEHQYNLLVQYGNPPLSAGLLPVAVDGLIVLASVCLTVIAERRRELLAGSVAGPVDEQTVTEAIFDYGRRYEQLRQGADPVSPVAADMAGLEPAAPVVLADRPVNEPDAEDALTAAARAVARDLTAAGRRVSRDALATGLRQRGHRIGTDRAAVLARSLAEA